MMAPGARHGLPTERRHSRLRPGAVLALSMACWSCVLVTGNVNPFARRPEPLQEHVVSGEGDAKLLIIDISGLITTEEKKGAFGFRTRESMVGRVEAELQRARQDDKLKGLIVRINSPGGTVTASDIIYERLMRFKRERQVPVVAQLMDVATSGGYYTALAADEIVAHPTTVTGSIGVVFTGVSVEGLLEKVGVRNQTIKTGEKKDIGSPLREMTGEEREILEALLGEMQARFMDLVRKRRPALTSEMEAQIADGRVFSAAQALDGKLVDRIGYVEDAVERARARAGLPEATVVMYRRPDEYAETMYSKAAINPARATLINLDLSALRRTPEFLYLWTP